MFYIRKCSRCMKLVFDKSISKMDYGFLFEAE